MATEALVREDGADIAGILNYPATENARAVMTTVRMGESPTKQTPRSGEGGTAIDGRRDTGVTVGLRGTSREGPRGTRHPLRGLKIHGC